MLCTWPVVTAIYKSVAALVVANRYMRSGAEAELASDRQSREDRTPGETLGTALRQARLDVGWSIERLASVVSFSPALVGFVERSQRRPSKEFIAACEKALGLQGELADLWWKLEPRAAPTWFRAWPKVESRAKVLRTWQPLVLPGLLQTIEYAQAILRCEPGVSAESIENALALRLQRQSIFDQPSPPLFSGILDETALHRPIGGKTVMRAQLEHLLAMMDHPTVTIQEVPLEDGAQPGLLGGFVLAQLPNAAEHAYLESTSSGQITDRIHEVQALASRYDAIRAWAHPVHVTERLIREALHAFT